MKSSDLEPIPGSQATYLDHPKGAELAAKLRPRRIVDRLVFAKHGPGVIRCQENLTVYIIDRLERSDERIRYDAVLKREWDKYVLTRYALPLDDAAKQWLAWGHVHRSDPSGLGWLILPIFLPEDVHATVFAQANTT